VSASSWRRAVGELAAAHGCTMERTRGDHLRIVHPSGWFVFAASTPGDHRALHHVTAELRRRRRRACGAP
jgi:class 3 adenylate cyclase